jgi:hypothetical protein
MENVTIDQINQYKALLLQKNSNEIMMSLFKSWIVTDATAQNFLRKHDGFNFILKRLFQEAKDQPDMENGPAQLIHDEISSDESETQGGDQEDRKLQFTTSRKSTASLFDKKNLQQPILKKQTSSQESVNTVF